MNTPTQPRRSGLVRTASLAAALAMVASVVNVVPGGAATLTVTRTADTNDGVCDADCSLREAIATAAAGDTIVFDGGLSGGIIRLTLGTLTLARNVTIDCSSLATPITISGDTDGNATPDVRVFVVNSGITANLAGLRIERGRARDHGGAIRNNGGNLTVTSVVLSQNRAASYGGGIYTTGGSLSVVSCAFDSNQSNYGGGILVLGTPLTITGSSFTGNTASYWGGGLFSAAAGRPLTIASTSFSANTA